MEEKTFAKEKKKETWRPIAIGICLAVGIFSGGMFLRDSYRGKKEEEANLALSRQMHEVEAALSEETAELLKDGTPDAKETVTYSDGTEAIFGESGELYGKDTGILLQYERLWKENHDLAGWLSIADTPVDYPVMYTPKEPEYYLRRGFDKKEAVSGSLFIDGSCILDSCHILIYGHKMRNRSMFGSLLNYADESYGREHLVMDFDTLYKRGKYELMAAFYSRVYTDQDQNVFRYYQYTDLSDPETFEAYVRNVQAAALYDTGVQAEPGDSLLTLSTCSNHVDNGRFVVVARKIPSDEE